jgi:hypothetical protein
MNEVEKFDDDVLEMCQDANLDAIAMAMTAVKTTGELVDAQTLRQSLRDLYAAYDAVAVTPDQQRIGPIRIHRPFGNRLKRKDMTLAIKLLMCHAKPSKVWFDDVDVMEALFVGDEDVSDYVCDECKAEQDAACDNQQLAVQRPN